MPDDPASSDAPRADADQRPTGRRPSDDAQGPDSTTAEESTLAQQLRALLTHSPDYLYFKDRTRRFVLASDSFCSLFNRPMEEIIGRRDEDLLPPEVAVETARDDQNVIETGQPLFNREEGGGDLPWVLTTKLPWLNDQGEVVGLFGITRDITERKRAEHERKASQDIIHKSFHASPDAVTITSMVTGKIIEANQRLFGLTGHPIEQVIGKTTLELGMWPLAEDRERMIDLLRRDGFIRGLEITLAHASGELRDCLLSAEQIQVDGEPHVLAFTRDITEQKKADRERTSLLKQLHQAQKMESLGQLAGGVAHDMNNMLTAVIGTISLMEGDPDDPSLRQRRIDGILEACTRGADLTSNLLGFARKGKYAPEPVALEGLFENTQQLLRKTIPKGIEVSVLVAAELHPIIADAGQLSHLLLNLCLNAADAIGSRGVLSIAAHNAVIAAADQSGRNPLAAGDYVRLTVTDTGSGMDAETRERAFEPFFTTKPQGKGTGLGLSMVYGTVTSHGGSVEIDSQLGEGTTVSILLPALTTAVEPEAPAAQPSPVTSRRGTLLLVDDEEPLRALCKELLERHGHTVLLAENGAVALEIYAERRDEIDLVLLDLSMPVMDGGEAFARLRELDPEAAVLLCSGHFEDERVRGLLSDGALGHVQKPYRHDGLAARVDDALST